MDGQGSKGFEKRRRREEQQAPPPSATTFGAGGHTWYAGPRCTTTMALARSTSQEGFVNAVIMDPAAQGRRGVGSLGGVGWGEGEERKTLRWPKRRRRRLRPDSNMLGKLGSRCLLASVVYRLAPPSLPLTLLPNAAYPLSATPM